MNPLIELPSHGWSILTVLGSVSLFAQADALFAQAGGEAATGWATRLWHAMVDPSGRTWLATILGGLGIWLLLPGSSKWLRAFGGALAVGGAVCAFSLIPMFTDPWVSCLFWALASVALTSAVGTITAQNPVYAAIWFALALLGVGGLFLVNGAQFLGIATVAVYAGAIVVTFLFVLMLAQPEGQAYYDRISWGRWASLACCLLGVGMGVCVIGALPDVDWQVLAVADAGEGLGSENHVARLGSRLFSTHLMAVQFAGVLLLAALVGAVAMAAHGADRRERRYLDGDRGGAV